MVNKVKVVNRDGLRMDDFVSRQKVLQCIKESRENIDWGQSEDGDAFLHYSAALYRTIASKECLSSADVEPVRHGRWIAEDNDGSWSSAVCSVCGRRVGLAHYETDFVKHFPYCHCGAKMGGVL